MVGCPVTGSKDRCILSGGGWLWLFVVVVVAVEEEEEEEEEEELVVDLLELWYRANFILSSYVPA